MSLRVIGGTARGMRLRAVPGDSTRPIRDQVKESLFNILGTRVAGSTWLDLFAGTGSVGIEALSRSAARAVFVDRAQQAVRTVRQNLEHTRLTPGAEVIRSDAFAYLERTSGRVFDCIYIAPPQYAGLWIRALQMIDERPALLAELGRVIVQIDPVEDQPVLLERLEEIDRRKYGSTLLLFFQVRSDG